MYTCSYLKAVSLHLLFTASESVPSDEIYEKAVTVATRVYQLEGEGEKLHYSLVQENTPQMVRVALLNSKKVCWFTLGSFIHLKQVRYSGEFFVSCTFS